MRHQTRIQSAVGAAKIVMEVSLDRPDRDLGAEVTANFIEDVL